MIFSKSEYIERLNKVKKSMQEKGIDLLVSQDTAGSYTHLTLRTKRIV